ncbi:sulfatase-like hydrolase/transferase [Nocardioides solisilvae]|uniref:sulfatase-like hydrolase/transferase n=1 Tax=Nocardioides solisilvae TaxID=1542435 RepID=UPI000D7466ED|nr:sulfatase-like hydrolase/transferase [Nocardioides solisilvae]
MRLLARGLRHSLTTSLCASLLLTSTAGCASASEPSGPETGGPSYLTYDDEGDALPYATVDSSRLEDGDGGDDRPNIIMVLTDDMRADELDQMPRTKALMRERGLDFTEAISPHPLCCPARAMILTGQYAQNNGVLHNESRYGGYHRIKTRNTLGTWFAEQGYNTGFIGKHANGYEHDSPRDPGWHVWEPITGNPTDYYRFQFFGAEVWRDDYVTHRIEEKTNDAIRKMAAADRPFMLLSNHIAPHERQQYGPQGLTDAPPSAKYADLEIDETAPMIKARSFNRKTKGGLPRKMRTKKIRRAAVQKKWEARVRSLRSVDDAVASMFAELDDAGEADNTYVFFTSDNGFSIGERRLRKKNNLVDESLRVPLVATGPGVPSGARSDLPVTLVDLVVTMADLGDVDPRKKVDGASFRRTLLGGEQPWRDTTLIQTGDKYNPRKDRRLRWKGWGLRGVRTDRYTWARDVNTGERLLFDRVRDPWEMRNVARAPHYRRTAAELDRRATRLMRCAGEACNRSFGKVPGPRRGGR